MRELPPPDELLLLRDADPILYVPAGTWGCPFCSPDAVTYTSVVWLGPLGRCGTCGQKLELAEPFEHVPAITEQLR